MWPQSLGVKTSLSHLGLTKGPDYFPGSDISQSVAHYCNWGLQGVSLCNVSGSDRRAIRFQIEPKSREFSAPQSWIHAKIKRYHTSHVMKSIFLLEYVITLTGVGNKVVNKWGRMASPGRHFMCSKTQTNKALFVLWYQGVLLPVMQCLVVQK